MGNVESSVNDLSVTSPWESTPIVGDFTDSDWFSNVNSNMYRLQEDIDILKAREDSGLPADFEPVRGEIGNYMSNNLIDGTLSAILLRAISRELLTIMATIDITTPDLTDVNVGLSNVNVGLSNVDAELVNVNTDL